ncbi:MAG: FmdB family zinc ribbon protein, partial [Actinomycetes bacterium]
MPTYQYACTACDERLEMVQRFTDDPLTECPRCAGRLRKVFSPVGVVFKGSGFYRTDSRASANGSGSAKGAPSSTDSGSSDGSAKSDSSATAKSTGNDGGSGTGTASSNGSSSGAK